MSDEKQDWQALIPELLKDWWYEEEALWLFTGYISDEYSFTNIKSGVDDTGGIFGAKHNQITEEWEILRKIWKQSSHPRSEEILRYKNPFYQKTQKALPIVKIKQSTKPRFHFYLSIFRFYDSIM